MAHSAKEPSMGSRVKMQAAQVVLLLMVAWYFATYVLTGICPKIFTGGLFGVAVVSQLQFAYFSACGGNMVASILPLSLKWGRLKKFRAAEYFTYLIPAGIATAIIIVTTTLMYSFSTKDFKLSVMVAVVIMRGSVIAIGRIVDAIQSWQGILNKKVTKEENIAFVIALLAVATAVFQPGRPGEVPFYHHLPAIITLGLYVGAYFLRIYIQNWYKNMSRGPNEAYLAAEQGIAGVTILAIVMIVAFSSTGIPQIQEVREGIRNPNWLAVLGGMPFGLAAVPSVLIMMYKGGTATFNVLVNRLTSLIAGTVATLLLVPVLGKWPGPWDWVSFAMILMAVRYLVKAERARSKLKLVEANAA